MAPCVGDGAFLRVTHPMLDFGEGLLDGVEVWRVRRQEPQPCSSGSDGCAHGFALVAAEIVHDHDIAWLQCRHELLFDIGTEGLAVDRTIEDARGGKLIAAQGAEEGQRAPMAVRSKAAQPLTLRSPAAQRRHIGLDPGFIEEHEPGRIEAILPGPPSLPPAGDVGTHLLKREQRFF